MSFLEKYAYLYDGAVFTKEEQAEIGAFAAEILKIACSGREEDLVTLFREEFGDMDADTFDVVNRYLGHVGDMEKTAQGLPHTLAQVLAPLSLALAATPLIQQAVTGVSRMFGQKSALKKAKDMYPELRDDPNVPEYARMLATFAPTVAANPILLGNLLVQMHKLGPGAVTPALIKDLVAVQKNIPAQPGEGLSRTLSPAAMSLASFYAKE